MILARRKKEGYCCLGLWRGVNKLVRLEIELEKKNQVSIQTTQNESSNMFLIKHKREREQPLLKTRLPD